MTAKRKRRLKKIKRAVESIAEVLLEFRKTGNPTLEQDAAWGKFYYLVALARKVLVAHDPSPDE